MYYNLCIPRRIRPVISAPYTAVHIILILYSEHSHTLGLLYFSNSHLPVHTLYIYYNDNNNNILLQYYIYMLIAHHINVYFTGRRRQTRCARIRSGSPPPAPRVPTPPHSQRLYTAFVSHTHTNTHIHIHPRQPLQPRTLVWRAAASRRRRRLRGTSGRDVTARRINTLPRGSISMIIALLLLFALGVYLDK